MKSVVTLTAVLLLIGCSELLVNKIDETAEMGWEDRKGLVYSLQFTQYKIDVTRGIANCISDDVPDVKAFIKAEIAAELVDDGDHVYVIDTDSLNGSTKITEMSVTWEDGKLVGFNASVDDQTAEVIAATASGIATLAKTFVNPLAPAAAVAAAAKQTPIEVVECKERTKDALTIANSKKKDIDKITKKLTSIQAKIVEEEERLSKVGTSSTLDCSNAANSNKPQCALEALIEKLKEQQKLLADATKAYTSALKKISYSETYRWPETSYEDRSKAKQIADKKLKEWLRDNNSLEVGDKVEVKFVVENVGSETIDSPINVTDPSVGKGINCPRKKLPPTFTVTCSKNGFTLKQDHLDMNIESLAAVATTTNENGDSISSDDERAVISIEKTVKRTSYPPVENIPGHQKDLSSFNSQFDVYFVLSKIGSYGKTQLIPCTKDDERPHCLVNSGDSEKPNSGIRYRFPARGYLVICKEKQNGCDRDNKEIAIAKHEGPVQQLGYIFHVPLKSKAFTNASLGLTFDSYGRPKTAIVGQPEAPAENAAKAFKGIVDEYSAYRAVVAGEKKTELQQIQEQTALINAQKELQDAQAKLDPTILPLSDLQYKTALAQQQKNYLDAVAALESVEKPDENAEAVAIINSELTLITAEIARLEALLALRQAQEALDQ